MVAIVADAREQGSRVPRELRALGLDVTESWLEVGDYVVARRCLVERKSVRDLHLSLIKGRLWGQLGALRKASDERYLLVEGRDLHGPLHVESIRGALLAANDLGITILRSTDQQDSAQWLARLATRRQTATPARVRPTYAQRPASPADHVGAAMLSAVPGISYVLATRLLDRFGSVAKIAAAPPHAWMEVEGVARRRADALEAALLAEAPTSRSAQRNGNRAT
jgi:ERCC4-type nuclease